MSSDLRVAVLGPVRAWRGNAELGVGAPQQQAVMAMRRARVAAGAGCMRSAIPLSWWKPVFVRLAGRATFGVWALIGRS